MAQDSNQADLERITLNVGRSLGPSEFNAFLRGLNLESEAISRIRGNEGYYRIYKPETVDEGIALLKDVEAGGVKIGYEAVFGHALRTIDSVCSCYNPFQEANKTFVSGMLYSFKLMHFTEEGHYKDMGIPINKVLSPSTPVEEFGSAKRTENLKLTILRYLRDSPHLETNEGKDITEMIRQAIHFKVPINPEDAYNAGCSRLLSLHEHVQPDKAFMLIDIAQTLGATIEPRIAIIRDNYRSVVNERYQSKAIQTGPTSQLSPDASNPFQSGSLPPCS